MNEAMIDDHPACDAPWRRRSDGGWRVAMRWHDLALLHWPVSRQQLQRWIPPQLEIDTYDGEAWLGIVPFRMAGVRFRFAPPLPGGAAFPELNVRTYVSDGCRRGVWFLTLDAASRLAVWGARTTYYLNYHHARMSLTTAGSAVRFSNVRNDRRAAAAEFVADYWPQGPVATPQTGTLESWFVNRYCLYAADRRGRVFRSDIDHAPWPLQPAAVNIARCTMTDGLKIDLPNRPPLAHFSRRIDAVAWPLEAVHRSRDVCRTADLR